MRLVVTTIAWLAALACLARVSPAQAPLPPYGGGSMATDRPPAPAPLAPSMQSSVEGAWVTDHDQPGPAGPGEVSMLPPTQGGFDPYGGQPANYAEAMAGEGGCPCGDGGFDGCDDCGGGAGGGAGHGGLCGLFQYNDLWTDIHAHRRMWVEPEYIQWFVKGNPLPPLVTTSRPDTPPTKAGVLPDDIFTTTLFGNERVDTSQRQGGRLNFGYWLVDGEFLGVEGQYFALGTAGTTFQGTASQFNGILAVPFVNVSPNLGGPTEDALRLFGFPQLSSSTGIPIPNDIVSSLRVQTTSAVQGASATLRKLIWIDFTSKRRLDLLLGYRFFRYDDSVTIDGDVPLQTFPQPFPLAFAAGVMQDQFSARNQFHGGDIGLKFQQYCCSRFSLELIGRCAFGANAEQVYINGSHATSTPGGPDSGPGGLLTQVTNIGQRTRDVFAVLPEANVNLRVDVTRNLRLLCGYSFIYLNRVQRSGDAIDRSVNTALITDPGIGGSNSPAFSFHDTSLWMYGFNGGFEYRW